VGLHIQVSDTPTCRQHAHVEGTFSCPPQSDGGGGSCAASSLAAGALSAPATQSTAAPAQDLPQRFAALFGENRELVHMLERTHTKLKAARARAAQAEAQLSALTGGQVSPIGLP